MAENPVELKYTKEHEWIRLKGNAAVIGVTDYAQHSLTDIVFVELPDAGKKVEAGKSVAIVESVKSVSDVFAPVAGEVTESNSKLSEKPQLINEDPYGEGWIFKIKISDVKETEKLMSKEQYEKYLKTAEH